MSSDTDKIPDILPDGMRVRSEELGFAAGELLPCPKCQRPNSPERSACIYCGSPLGTALESTLKADKADSLETWEKGFNAAMRVNADAVDELSKLFGINKDLLDSAADGGSYLPAVRTRDEDKAASVAQRLRESGVESVVVSDLSLMAEKPPVRLRSIEFGEDGCLFVEFNTGNHHTIPTEEIRLMVTGELIVSRTESKFKKKPKKDERPEETITDTDRPVIDIYTSPKELGYRVQINGFDFSGLGDAKGMLAVENMRMLAVRLKDVARGCRVDTKYNVARPLLDRIWELETETDHLGVNTVSFMTKEKTKVSVVSNLHQFTKYSRLQRLSI